MAQKPLSPEGVEGMRAAGRLAAKTLDFIAAYVKPGVTTNELDKLVYEFTKDHGAEPAPLGYHGYPKSICTSVNECICHGLPDDQALREGDIINIDVTPKLNGYHGDSSRTFFVGEVSERAKLITQVAKEAMERGIEVIRPYGTVGDIGFATQKYVTKKGFFAVKEIGGHGINTKFHDEPFVPSFGKKGRGDVLIPWTCITVEPMINENDLPYLEKDIPGSSIKYYETQDKTLSAQFEHTVLITDTGYEILTLSE